ncbi:MAG TPA: hypothetical protein VMU38_06500 [Candidatus Binatia bacterium]|nr:hypothetical protein [Candidatus Binatia bacterium]
MKLSTFTALGALVALQAQAASPAPSLDLLRRAANPNPTLNSYTASASLSAVLHAVIPVRKNLTGTVYYLRPKRKIEFQNLSGPLSRFKDLASTTPTYDEATAQYAITPLEDDGTVSTYQLVPKNTGSRVKSLTVTVNDQSALVSHAQWAYTNGGSLSFDQSYSPVGSYRLPSTAVIAARFPGYSVDGTMTFSNYKPNAPVSAGVFQ